MTLAQPEHTAETDLFSPELVFTTTETDQTKVFQEIAAKLVSLDAVKPTFIDNILEREANYPTGIDMSVISPDLPNIAIPHTEGQFVNIRKVIPVRLEQPVVFNNMIKPKEALDVSYLFMILNNDPEGQANILAQIMDFVSKTPLNQLKTFFKTNDKAAIFAFLERQFTIKNY